MKNLKIVYGIEHVYVEVTNKALLYNFMFNKSQKNKLILPETDIERANLFGDHLDGIVKHVIISYKSNHFRFDHGEKIEFTLEDNFLEEFIEESRHIVCNTNPMEKLNFIHKHIKFLYGSMVDELPEQLMATTFIYPENIVLELGANIGRNTMVISCLLNDTQQLVTLETDKNTCEKLNVNKYSNQFHFHVENSALSNRMLIQKDNSWESIVSDVSDVSHEIPDGYFKINTIGFNDLEQKYNKKFDTLVADCEGALYYIFQDFPNALTNIHTVMMENDYHDISHKHFVNDFLTKNGFKCVYKKGGGWGPCADYFFETWKKI